MVVIFYQSLCIGIDVSELNRKKELYKLYERINQNRIAIRI